MTDHDDDRPSAIQRETSAQHIVVRRTSPHGVPVTALPERSSRAHRIPDPDEVQTVMIEQLDPLDIRIDGRFDSIFPASFDNRLRQHNDKRFRKLWGWLGGVAGTALVALIAAGKSWLTEARTEGAAEYRIQIIERDAERNRSEAKAEIDRLRLEIDSLRATMYRGARGRDDQPDPPVSSASKRTLP